MVKIFIATPAFEGKVHVPFAISLAETSVLLSMHQIGVQYQIVTSGSLLEAERNRLVDAFLRSDCTHMLCLDSDLGWPAQAVLALLQKNEDFIAGVYPTRLDKSFTFRPKVDEKQRVIANPEKQLLEMESIPAGFMLIKRCVFERIMDKFPEIKFTPKAKDVPPGFAFFLCEIWEGEFWGEDYTFCRRVRESGTRIWVDPMIEFDHAGNRGMLMSALSTEPPKPEGVQNGHVDSSVCSEANAQAACENQACVPDGN